MLLCECTFRKLLYNYKAFRKDNSIIFHKQKPVHIFHLDTQAEPLRLINRNLQQFPLLHLFIFDFVTTNPKSKYVNYVYIKAVLLGSVHTTTQLNILYLKSQRS